MADDPIRDALRMMPYGFYAVTSRFADDENIMVANWIMQVSFEPTLVALALQKTAYTHGLVTQSGVFCVNLFRKEDSDVLKEYTKGRVKNPDKMKGARFSPAKVTGCPVLDEAAAYLEFEVSHMVDVGGDHDLVVGKVVGGEVIRRGSPEDMVSLVHLGWSYAG